MNRTAAVPVIARRKADRPGSVAALVRVWGRGSVVAVLMTLSLVLLGEGRPGDLDPTFGMDGKVTTDFQVPNDEPGSDEARALVLQPDGKLVAAGAICTNFFDFCDVALVRYLPDGRLDPTFGVDGKVTTDFGGEDSAWALVLQPDGKLVAAGEASGDSNFGLMRYLPDGRLDPTFGGGGVVTTDFGGRDQANALVLLPDGKLVAAGSSFFEFGIIGDIGLARYVGQQPVVNDLVSFDPIQSTFTVTPDPAGCPEGIVGKFSFEGQLTNTGDRSLTDLVVVVATLTNGNLLQNADGGPGGTGSQLTVPRQEGFTDGRLTPDEFVDVPFIICLTEQQPFRLVVDVSGEAE